MQLSKLLRGVPAVLLATILAAQLLAEPYLNKRVVVRLKSGGRIAGLVVEEKADGAILIQLGAGRVWVKAENIDGVEVQKAPKDEYEERVKAAKTADDWVALAKWCGLGDINLPKEREYCLEQALKLDAEHEGAHKERGDIKVNGKWYPEEEGYKLKGYEKVDGKWMTPDEAKRHRHYEQLKKNKQLKGLLEQEKEREGRPWATVKPIETENYLVKCNSTAAVAKYYSDVMEALYRAYSEILPDREYPRFTTEKGPIYIFRNQDEFLDFTLMSQGVGGFFSFVDRAVRAYHGSFGITGSTEMVLAHEATHQLQYRIMRDMRTVPTWLIEGMAVYYGDGTKITSKKVDLHVIPRDRLLTLQEAIDTNRYTPVKTLLRIPQFAFGGQFYNHAWGVIYWCLQGEKYKAHKGEGKRVWEQYLKHCCAESKDFSEAMQNPRHFEDEAKYFEDLLLRETGYKSLADWETEYKKFIMSLKLDPLGVWKEGNLWDGSAAVGISLRFPSVTGMQRVPDRQLRHQFREAAAMETKDGKGRIWVSVDANWSRQASEDPSVFMNYINGFFEDVSFGESGSGSPKVLEYIKQSNVVKMVASFTGKFAQRRERSTFAVNRGRKKEGESEKKEAGKKDEKKDDADDKKSKKDEAPEATKIPTGLVGVKTLFIATGDKIYFIAVAGDAATYQKIEPHFIKMVESIRITF